MKTKNKLITLFGIGSIVIMNACTADFVEMNTNPNTSPNAMPESFLGPAVFNVVSANVRRAHSLNNELMQDQVTVSSSTSNQIHRHILLPKESKDIWDGYYPNLADFRTMYQNAEGLKDGNFMAVSLIGDVWISSLITDCFGDVPYSEACKGDQNILQPRFDKQRDIYADLFQKLEQANALLYKAASDTMTSGQSALDPIYHGSLQRWRKFGNSLYLRLLMRASGKTDIAINFTPAEETKLPNSTDMSILQKIAQIAGDSKSYPIMVSNDDSAILPFSQQKPYTSPFFGGRNYDFNGGNGLTEFFVQTLQGWNDPRLKRWGTEATLGVYAGIPSGYASGDTPEIGSAWALSLKEDEPLMGNILNYAEVQFILAEAAARGFIDSSLTTRYYETGITSAITLWGLSLPEGHLEQPTVALSTNESQEKILQKILTQKYFTLLFTGMQQWHEYMRTGYPELYPLKDLANSKPMPHRFVYPTYIQSLNLQHYQEAVASMGADDNDSAMWWQIK